MSPTYRVSFLAAAVAALFSLAAPAARAAESYDSCTSTITSLPAVITTQGTWCLRADLATTLSSGDAIVVNTNNVTIDCNGFKLGGLGAGESTMAVGIRAVDRANLAVRNCNVRGFAIGVAATGHGLLIENNRFENNRQYAIDSNSAAGIIRGNLAQDTGEPARTRVFAMRVRGSTDILDNTISGVSGATGTYVVGILVEGASTIAGNRVRGVRSAVGAFADGIAALAGGAVRNSLVMRDNDVSFDYAGTVTAGFYCDSDAQVTVFDNIIVGASVGTEECGSASGNLFVPF